LDFKDYLLERRLIMGKKWKKIWLTRKVAAAKKAAEVVKETVKTTKKVKKVKKSPFWKRKKED